MKVLVVDVGGKNVKLLATGRRTSRRFPSGPKLTPSKMVAGVLETAAGWSWDAVTIGIPAPVVDGKPLQEPHNLAGGWRRFDFEAAFRCPVAVMNDAAMQALGSYEGGRMLFLGLGTGLGSATVDDGKLVPLELAHLPYRKGKSYEDYLGDRGRRRLGQRKWEQHVRKVTGLLMKALVVDYVVLGGGNVEQLSALPPGTRRGDNQNAFAGGFRVWENAARVTTPSTA